MVSIVSDVNLNLEITGLGLAEGGSDIAPGPTSRHRSSVVSFESSEAAPVEVPDLQSCFLPSTAVQAVLTVGPLVITDLLALSAAGFAALGLAHALHIAPAHWLGWKLPFTLAPLAIVLPGIFSTAVGLHPVVELRKIVVVLSLVFIGLIGATMLQGNAAALDVFFSLAWVFSLFCIPLARALARRVCGRQRWWGFACTIVGSGPTLTAVVRQLTDCHRTGLRPVAIAVPHFSADYAHQNLPVVPLDFIDTLADSHAVRYAVLALPDASRAQIAEIADRYLSRVPHRVTLASAAAPASLWQSAGDCAGFPSTHVPNGLLLPGPRLVKRVMDLVLATIALVLGFPAMALIALAVKLTSRGPVFYGHRRIGRGGKYFKAWKFRTMRADADQVLEEYLNGHPEAREEWKRDHKLKADPRITPIGSFLRKTSLDELPQLWNVLKGEMSLVGPRPIVDEEIVKYGNIFPIYTKVLPGLTGLWQVSGRNDTTYLQRVALDNFYVQNWSVWADLTILVSTLRIFVGRDGAY